MILMIASVLILIFALMILMCAIYGSFIMGRLFYLTAKMDVKTLEQIEQKGSNIEVVIDAPVNDVVSFYVIDENVRTAFYNIKEFQDHIQKIVDRFDQSPKKYIVGEDCESYEEFFVSLNRTIANVYFDDQKYYVCHEIEAGNQFILKFKSYDCNKFAWSRDMPGKSNRFSDLKERANKFNVKIEIEEIK